MRKTVRTCCKYAEAQRVTVAQYDEACQAELGRCCVEVNMQVQYLHQNSSLDNVPLKHIVLLEEVAVKGY